MSGKIVNQAIPHADRKSRGDMRSKWSFTAAALFVFSAVFIVARVASQSAPPPAQPAAAQKKDSGQSGYVLKVTTRLVTVDLVATDSRGNPVRDLKPEEVQIFEERKSPQKIEHFEYFEKLKNGGT